MVMPAETIDPISDRRGRLRHRTANFSSARHRRDTSISTATSCVKFNRRKSVPRSVVFLCPCGENRFLFIDHCSLIIEDGSGLGASAAANSFGQLNAGKNTLSFMEPGGGPGMGAIANSLGNMAMPSSLTSGGNGLARLLPPPAAGIAMQSRAGPYAKVLPGNPAAIKRGSCRFNISGWSIHQKGKEAQSR